MQPIGTTVCGGNLWSMENKSVWLHIHQQRVHPLHTSTLSCRISSLKSTSRCAFADAVTEHNTKGIMILFYSHLATDRNIRGARAHHQGCNRSEMYKYRQIKPRCCNYFWDNRYPPGPKTSPAQSTVFGTEQQ